jgi:hypothetical protein
MRVEDDEELVGLIGRFFREIEQTTRRHGPGATLPAGDVLRMFQALLDVTTRDAEKKGRAFIALERRDALRLIDGDKE